MRRRRTCGKDVGCQAWAAARAAEAMAARRRQGLSSVRHAARQALCRRRRRRWPLAESRSDTCGDGGVGGARSLRHANGLLTRRLYPLVVGTAPAAAVDGGGRAGGGGGGGCRGGDRRVLHARRRSAGRSTRRGGRSSGKNAGRWRRAAEDWRRAAAKQELAQLGDARGGKEAAVERRSRRRRRSRRWRARGRRRGARTQRRRE